MAENQKSIIDGKRVLITGGTGSLGKQLIADLLKHHKPSRLIVFSRDELKQHEMKQNPIYKHPSMRFFIGDVRDKDRLMRAFKDVDIVIHTAALKQVDTAEYNPSEFIRTNINGALNIVDAALDCGVERVLALSTDKATSPINLYGATKLCSDKIFVAANSYAGDTGTKFSVVRYGNVMCSRGSVIPLWIQQAKETGTITLTDTRMTRFSITLPEASQNVRTALDVMVGGELFVFKSPSYKLTDLARVIAPNAKIKTIGLRPGEKIHEAMITDDDSRNTYEYENFYIIHPTLPFWDFKPVTAGGQAVPEGFSYTSANNKQWLTDQQVINLVQHSLPQGQTFTPTAVKVLHKTEDTAKV